MMLVNLAKYQFNDAIKIFIERNDIQDNYLLRYADSELLPFLLMDRGFDPRETRVFRIAVNRLIYGDKRFWNDNIQIIRFLLKDGRILKTDIKQELEDAMEFNDREINDEKLRETLNKYYEQII